MDRKQYLKEYYERPGKKEKACESAHCHETGEPRGMLCATCNKALGLLGDTEEGVQRALAYLSKFRGLTHR